MNSHLKTINAKALKANLFSLLDDDWMLITAGNANKFNTMTASWGTFGILWNKPIAIGFIRPQRYTYKFVNENEFFTLSFFPKEFRTMLEFCGAHSGKDTDKVAKTGLIPVTTDKGSIYFAQAHLVLECKKLYVDDIKSENFIDKNLIKNIYPGGDFHRFFIGEITNCLASEKFMQEKNTNFAEQGENNTTDF